jgi:endonuclease YncB( thermonuclease family)
MPPAPPPARDAVGAMNMLLHAARLRVRRSAAVGLIATLLVATAQIGMVASLAVTLTATLITMATQSRAQAPFSATGPAARAVPVIAVASRASRVPVAAAVEPAVADCGAGDTITGAVASVIDGRSFLFADGREIRLAAVETPPLGGPDAAHDEGVAAKLELESLLHDQVVTVRPMGAADRYGRVVGFVFTALPDALVQREMLEEGYALLSPVAMPTGCRGALRGAERSARIAKLGLWGDPYYEIKRAEDPADVLAQRGRFAVVGGKVQSVRESGGIVYVNFGRRWAEDFTVTILKRNERLFAGAGLPPSRLSGRWIEVRGFVEEHGGPAIEATRPEQIEFVDGTLPPNR